MVESAFSPLPEEHAAWRELRPLGHELWLWCDAMRHLQIKVAKGRLGESLLTFLREWMPTVTLPDERPPSFEVTLSRDGPQANGALAAVADPAWWALLHLPALRDFWITELRASHYQHLIQLVPPAWCMDSAPLPPGSVIAGLGIAGWSLLPALSPTGRPFQRHQLDSYRTVLTTETKMAQCVVARYLDEAGRITLGAAFLA